MWPHWQLVHLPSGHTKWNQQSLANWGSNPGTVGSIPQFEWLLSLPTTDVLIVPKCIEFQYDTTFWFIKTSRRNVQRCVHSPWNSLPDITVQNTETDQFRIKKCTASGFERQFAECDLSHAHTPLQSPLVRSWKWIGCPSGVCLCPTSYRPVG